jgi:hypothetical protein
MSKKANPALVADVSHRRPPVRVRTRRITASSVRLYPPNEDRNTWWDRLKNALGTSSSDFVSASLVQLKAAAQFPGSGISEVGINAALAQIEALAPQNEVEAALAVQMACTHAAATSVLARFGGGGGSDRRVIALASAAARLLRAYSGQVETLHRLRHGGDQYVRVEHVHINEGGQAVIGNVRTQRGKAAQVGKQATGDDPNEGYQIQQDKGAQ